MNKIFKLLMRKNCIKHILLFFLILVGYVLNSCLVKENTIETIESIMILICIGIFIYSVRLIAQNGMNLIKLCNLIILIGLVIRIGYMLYTPCYVRSHDLYLGEINSGGHAGYILNILEGHLPKSNKLQYYHPPLYYILTAITIRIVNIFTNPKDVMDMINGAKVISCFASCSILFIYNDIMKELNFKEKSKIISITFVSFLPNFFLLAGRVNNDSLSIFFISLCILYSIRWYKECNYKNTIMLAVSFGLGMMTKISVASFAFITGTLMIIKMYKLIKEKELISLIKKLCVFILISFPLGLGYLIRNYILFNQPFNYVLDIKTRGDMYCGGYSFFERFINLPFKRIITPLYNNPLGDYNTIIYLLKGGVFGEFKYSINSIIPTILLIAFILLNICSIMAIIIYIINKKEDKLEKFILVSTIGVFYILYICFNIKYPYTCTMDYRYIVPIAISQGLILGRAYEIVKKYKWSKVYNIIVSAILAVFAIFSTVMFCGIK